MIVHIVGINYEPEPLPHELYFCGTFFAYLLIGIFGTVAMFLGYRLYILLEAIISFTATALFMIANFVSMAHVVKDFHLTYLTNEEEEEHFFLRISRTQSMFCVATACFHLMHAIFCVDILMIREPVDENPDEFDVNL